MEPTPMEKIKMEYQKICINLGEIFLQKQGLEAQQRKHEARVAELNTLASQELIKEQQEKLKAQTPEVLPKEE